MMQKIARFLKIKFQILKQNTEILNCAESIVWSTQYCFSKRKSCRIRKQECIVCGESNQECGESPKNKPT